METFCVRLGSVIFWRRWLWVVERQINASWRMRRLGDGLITLLSHGHLLEALDSRHLFVISDRRNAYLEALSAEEISRLVSELSRHAAPTAEVPKWQAFSSRKVL